MAIPLHKQILNSAAVSEGEWVNIGAMAIPFSIFVYDFAAGDVAQIYISNKLTQPALADPVAGDGTRKLGADITTDVAQITDFAVKWIRVRKSAADPTPKPTKADLFAYAAFVF